MRPDRVEMLVGIRRALLDYFAPEVTTIYGRSQLGYATNLLLAIARESEDAVAVLVDENDALRRLLRRAASVLDSVDSGLARELVAGAKRPGRLDLRVSALRAESSRLMALFIRAQTACEDALDRPAVARLHRSTVTFLRHRVERQASIQPFGAGGRQGARP